jgi:exonuclease VII large subunit
MSKITVTELNNTISQAIKENVRKTVTVVGEISNPKVSGRHTYLTLKDAHSSISVAFWGMQLKSSEAKHGDNVEITGKIDYYMKSGNVNLIGKKIEKVGIGSIHAQYEKIRKQYEKKGYFDNKKTMPKTINDIGVVTAENGAALQDFIRVLRNNKFGGRVFVYNATVQGPRCADSVAAGIKFFDSPFYLSVDNRVSNNITDQITSDSDSTSNDSKDKSANVEEDVEEDVELESDDGSIDPFSPEFLNGTKDNKTNSELNIDNKYDEDSECSEDNHSLDAELEEEMEELQDEYEQIEVDVVVITRGGGSFEDLMGFSDPKVLEAVYKSKRYTISSVGHEVDDMLSDFAANCAVGTPSMAGDIISKTCSDGFEKLHEIEKRIMRFKQDILRKLYATRQKVVKIESGLEDPIKKIIKTIESVQAISKNKFWKSIKRYSKKNKRIIDRIATHDSKSLLAKGFSVLVSENGKIIKNTDNLFDQNVKLIHETGDYMVRIVRIE